MAIEAARYVDVPLRTRIFFQEDSLYGVKQYFIPCKNEITITVPNPKFASRLPLPWRTYGNLVPPANECHALIDFNLSTRNIGKHLMSILIHEMQHARDETNGIKFDITPIHRRHLPQALQPDGEQSAIRAEWKFRKQYRQAPPSVKLVVKQFNEHIRSLRRTA